MLRHLLALALSLVAFPVAAQIRWDAGQQRYFVTAHDDAGQPVEMMVEPGNLVTPMLRFTPIDSGTSIRYRFVVGADSGSPLPLTILRLPCPSEANVSALSGGDSRRLQRWGEVRYCKFFVYRGPGRSRQVAFSSPWLAGPGWALAVGGATSPTWPTTDPNSETGELSPLVDSLQGDTPTGLLKRFRAPVPMYERVTVAQATTGLPILAEALSTICTETDWIQPGPTCDALTAQIAAASTALGTTAAQRAAPPQAAKNEVRQALTALIQSLSAGRGTTINENAFSILNLLARTVRSGLGS